MIFQKKLITELFKYLNINKYNINLKIDKKLCYKLIYNLCLIKLKIFKITIKINLTNSLI